MGRRRGIGPDNVTSIRCLLRLLPLLAALLLLPTQPLGTHAPIPHESVLESGRHGAQPPASGEFITRKQRHAASLEEYFAIDDDSEQHFVSQARVVASQIACHIEFAEPQPVLCYREWRPSHRPNAALPTGPPSA
jgi:hypothetical protein